MTIDPKLLEQKEKKKRKIELIAIGIISVLFLSLLGLEYHLTQTSSNYPLINSIFFFGLLNLNIILLIALIWLVLKNIGKLFLERKRKVLGSHLKTKLVLAFLGFSITPTILLFIISSFYINSSFEKWFSTKVQDTLESSLEVTKNYYEYSKKNSTHFANHIANEIQKKIITSSNNNKLPTSKTLERLLDEKRKTLALDAIEFYSDPLQKRLLSHKSNYYSASATYPRLSLDILRKALKGKEMSIVQKFSSGDLIRSIIPIKIKAGTHSQVLGLVTVNFHVPIQLVNNVGTVTGVINDFKETTPLKFPIKTTYFVILVLITLAIIFVEIWMGLYLARQLTTPVANLVKGAKEVGSGNLDVKIDAKGSDEITVLVNSFNKMTKDLKENREKLTLASTDLEKRKQQLETVLKNIGTGVLVIDNQGIVTTFNTAAGELLELDTEKSLNKLYKNTLNIESRPLIDLIKRSLKQPLLNTSSDDIIQWNFRTKNKTKSLVANVSFLEEIEGSWGLIIVIDDISHLIKDQRETAWREVARRIAHEIKNPLTPIKLSAQRLQRKGNDNHELLQECTTTIIKHTDELKDMVNEFSNFARFPEISPAPNNINDAIREVIALFSQAHPQVRFEFQEEEKLPIFDFDRDQIKRVVINLINNAIAAIKDKKQSTIQITTNFNQQLQMALIDLKDNGPGMKEPVLSRVFEPYFSTNHEGTGLGLAIVKRIINDHNGFIRVFSHPGQGTHFLIELPITIKHGIKRFSKQHEEREVK